MVLLIIIEVAFCGLLIGIDLFTKGVIMPFLLENGGHYDMLEGVLELTYAKNYGASFGIFKGQTELLLAISIITIIALIGILVYIDHEPKLLRFGLLTIIGGAIGNVYDRITLEYVRDFIEYTFFETWFDFKFAIGNIADIFCLVGVVMIISYVFFDYQEGEINSRFKRFNKCKSI